MLNRPLLVTFSLYVFLSCGKGRVAHNENTGSPQDSISVLLDKSKMDAANGTKYLKRAKYLNDQIFDDSLKKEYALQIAYYAFKNPDSLFFKSVNKQALDLSMTLKDTSGIAETHWNSGSFYAHKEVLDSAYYHYYQAHKYYEILENENYSAKMLFNMAFIQSRSRDYVSSENKLFQAIEKYQKLEKSLSLYRCYNALGTIYKELEDYDNSIRYHQKSLEVLEDVDNDKTYYERGLNDIGVTYRKQGDYKQSIVFFNKALTNEIFERDPNLYAILVDNRAYSKLLEGDTSSVKHHLFKALQIRDSIQNISGISVNKLHLAEYFLVVKDTIAALKYAKESYDLASATKNKRDILSALLLLSKSNPQHASLYLKEHIELTDDLEKEERKLRNKFARISFETEEYIERAEILSAQRRLLILSAIALLTIFSLIYFLRNQRSKTKELQLKNEQQEANEEIYRLMLNQQDVLEKGRLNERHRISEELHDGVLGKIFGTRMGLGFLNIQASSEDLEKHENYIANLQKIEEEIRDISHELKNEILSSKRDYLSIIKALVEELSDIGGFDYEICDEESTYWNDANDTIKINCYRILQESVQNIIKHAKATKVSVVFDYYDAHLNLRIIDNGIGFNKKKKHRGIGLSNIRSRVEHINGKLIITSHKNKGTELSILIPNIT